ncbi:lipopolysaccharide assembly protein LapB [Flavobacterium sp. GT3R68]|uniref:tetratricopeptide repeat protein n=1 Tax=Flavobacterium sp. GT3R68 TaxID=2594437 RepID=UPI000F87360A|nr:hypothetical protein [Flavobacterium sp. GT3R68]RTY92429.1 hypothetical protein EKL32_16620 [Flavobacterium sp. GSN2]TRW94053.1 hypothetical protein FNW07_03835 [Flavobacterium sp. GT3R68]
MKTKITFIGIAFFSFFITAHAQDSGCTEKVMRYNDLVKANEWNAAFLPWSEVRMMCPSFDETIYTTGSKILQYKIDNAATADEKEIIIRDLLKLYDQYDKNFPKNNNGNVINKAMALYDAKIGTPNEIYALLDSAFKKYPENFTNPSALYVYFDLFYKQFTEGTNGIQVDDILARRDAVFSRIAVASKDQTADKRAYRRVSEGIDALISGVANCEKLIPYYQKTFESKKADVVWLEGATAYLVSKKCTSDSLFIKLATELHQVNPTSKSAYYLGLSALKNKKQKEAIVYFSQSAELSTSTSEKAKTYFMAASLLNNSNKSEARDMARKAILADPSLGEAYLLIARLYAKSGSECGENAFDKKAINFLAAETARKAGEVAPFLKATANMQADGYLKNAPSRAEIKEAKKSGKNIVFNCWINESVRVPKL